MRRQHSIALRAPGRNSGSAVSARSCGFMASLRLPRSFEQSSLGLINHVIHYSLVILCFCEHFQLTVRSASLVENTLDMTNLLGTSEFLHLLAYKLENFANQIALRHFTLFSEIDQLPVESVARGTPLILHDQRTAVVPKREILAVKPVKLRDNRLAECGNCNCLIEAHGNIAHAKL